MILNFKLNDKEYKVEPNYIKNSTEYVYITEDTLLAIVKYFHNKNEYEFNDFLYIDITDKNNNVYFVNNINSGNLYLRYMNSEQKKKNNKKKKK